MNGWLVVGIALVQLGIGFICGFVRGRQWTRDRAFASGSRNMESLLLWPGLVACTMFHPDGTQENWTSSDNGKTWTHTEKDRDDESSESR